MFYSTAIAKAERIGREALVALLLDERGVEVLPGPRRRSRAAWVTDARLTVRDASEPVVTVTYEYDDASGYRQQDSVTIGTYAGSGRPVFVTHAGRAVTV